MSPARVLTAVIAAVLLVVAVVVAALPTSINVYAGNFGGTRDCGSVLAAKPDAVPDLPADFFVAHDINVRCRDARHGRLVTVAITGIAGLTFAVLAAAVGRRRAPIAT